MSKANASKTVKATEATPVKAGKGKGKGRKAAGELDIKVEQTTSGGNRMTVFATTSACKILKWMGYNQWSRKEATVVCTHLWPMVSGSTIGCQLYSGRALAAGKQPTHSGKVAELSKEQVAELEALRAKLCK